MFWMVAKNSSDAEAGPHGIDGTPSVLQVILMHMQSSVQSQLSEGCSGTDVGLAFDGPVDSNDLLAARMCLKDFH